MNIEQLQTHYSNYSINQLLLTYYKLQEEYQTFGDPANHFSKINYYYTKRINVINQLIKLKREEIKNVR